MKTIDNFHDKSGKYKFLSNFYEAEIIWVSTKFKTVEHAYQAEKAHFINNYYDIINCATPHEAKKLGQQIKIRDDWDDIKIPTMRELLLCKFTQHKDLNVKLLETGDAEIIEGNTWGDTFWGQVDGLGENHLGKLLMEVRGLLCPL